MHPALKAACALACVLAGASAALAEQPGPPPLPNGARVPPGTLGTRGIPPGIDTGTPAASPSLPLGTPAAPPVLVGPERGVTPLGTAQSSRPPRLTQDPLARSRPHDAAVEDPPAGAGRGERGVGGNRTTTLGPAVTATHDVGDFPPGLTRCVDLVDRSARGECAHDLYDRGGAGR
jgi:hypothetical protein